MLSNEWPTDDPGDGCRHPVHGELRAAGAQGLAGAGHRSGHLPSGMYVVTVTAFRLWSADGLPDRQTARSSCFNLAQPAFERNDPGPLRSATSGRRRTRPARPHSGNRTDGTAVDVRPVHPGPPSCKARSMLLDQSCRRRRRSPRCRRDGWACSTSATRSRGIRAARSPARASPMSTPTARRSPTRRSSTRIRKLAIPPAYTDVWICPSANGHHPGDRARRQAAASNTAIIPLSARSRESTQVRAHAGLRRGAAGDPQAHRRAHGLRGLPREKVLATVVHLLENDADPRRQRRLRQAEQELRPDDAARSACEGRAAPSCGSQFKGKSGKTWSLQVKDRRIAKIVKACQDLPGQELFQYLDEDGERADRSPRRT